MHVRILVSAILLSAFAAPSRADFYFNGPKNQTWFIASPQLGMVLGSSRGPVYGASASYYIMPIGGPGVGVGAYGYGSTYHLEWLAKLSILGFAGASAGACVQDGQGGITGDLWASAVMLGLRYKVSHVGAGTSHAWTVFVPLWYLDWE